MVVCLCNFLEYFITKKFGKFVKDEKKEFWQKKINAYFSYSFMWSFGGSFNAKAQEFKIDNIIKDNFGKIKFPSKDLAFDYFIDPQTLRPTPWQDVIPNF